MCLKPSLTLFSCCLLLWVASSRAHVGGRAGRHQDVRPQHYCGRSLARAIAFLCYDDLPSEKRSEAGTMYHYKVPAEALGDWPRVSLHQARGVGLPSRGKRFVVNECCDKACSVQELLSYCD